MGFFSIRRTAKTADLATFQTFYQDTLKPLQRHLQSLGLHHPEELEDVLQNTYLEAHRSFAELKDPVAGLAWLLTIGRRQYYLFVTRQVKQRKIFMETSQEQKEAVGDSNLVPGDIQISFDRIRDQVMQLMDDISNPKKKQAIQLFFLDGLSLKDIALQTDTNVSTLTTWISRFRKQAQPLLRKDQELDAAEALLATREVFP